MKRLVLVLSTVLAVFTLSIADQIFTIKVEGMTCKMCPIAIKKSLKQVKGVKKVKASLKTKLAIVVADDSVKPEELLKAIRRAGMYKGTILKVEKK